MEYIREACELLECNEVDFIRDAATWKANQVKKLVVNNVPLSNFLWRAPSKKPWKL